MKAKINFIIDAIMFVLMGLLAGIGLLIKYVLVSGEERWIKYGQNVDIRFWGLDRHQWGEIHLYVAIALILFLVLHIVLHWNMIVCLYKRIIGHRRVRIFCGLIFIGVTLLLVLFPYFIRVETSELASGRERFKNLSITDTTTHVEKSVVSTKPEKKKVEFAADVQKKEKELHHNIDPSIEVKGLMTLSEVSRKYDVPSDYIKQKLNIPLSTSNASKLGHLRKRYGFKMSELEIIIANYKK
ncbi:MAG TPA: DUF4405 domain-containing protein [Bacteroidales bacterium]|nr:DUF4405 domain-containing protein [Bacteroidales bacterium]